MRIVHLLWGLTFGGIETMVINIANEQSRAGHEVTLVTVDRDIDPRLAADVGPSVGLRCAARPKGSHNPWYLMRLNWIMRQLDADFVHFHGVNLPRLVRGRYVRRWCTTHHTTWRSDLARFFTDDLHLVAISGKAAEDLRAHADVHPEVVVNGIATGEYLRRDVGSPATPLRIVQVGRLNFAIKGQDITLDAVRMLKARGIGVHVDFIGDGEAHEAMARLTAKLGLENEVTMHGSLPQEFLKEHLKDYDLLVQPSRIEGFGLTVAEAMAARVPVAVADLPPLLEVIDGGNCGISFHADDAADLARAIEQSATDYDLQRVGRAAERVGRLYDVSATAQAYLRLYEKF